jgi:hypothetical protein
MLEVTLAHVRLPFKEAVEDQEREDGVGQRRACMPEILEGRPRRAQGRGEQGLLRIR